MTNPGSAVYQDEQRVYARNLEVPSGGGVGTARGIAHAYGVFATGGRELGLRQETLDLLAAPAIPSDARVLRRMHEGRRHPVLARLHEVHSDLAVRQRPLVRIAWSRRLAWLCGSGGRHRVRVRDEPDGDGLDRRPARCGAQRRALLRAPEFRANEGLIVATIRVIVTRHPVATDFALTFAISCTTKASLTKSPERLRVAAVGPAGQ